MATKATASKATATKKPQDHKKSHQAIAAEIKARKKYDTVTVAGVEYDVPDFTRLNRKRVKQMRQIEPTLSKIGQLSEDESMGSQLELTDLMYDVVQGVFPDIPAGDVEELLAEDLKAMLSISGILYLSGDDVQDEGELTIKLGESSASTGS